MPPPGADSAGRRSCSLCPFTGPASDKKTVITSVTIRNTGTVLPIQQTISCRDTHCLYILSCTKTGYMKQYAGLSSRPLYIRFAEHLADIQSSSDCTLVQWQALAGARTHCRPPGVPACGEAGHQEQGHTQAERNGPHQLHWCTVNWPQLLQIGGRDYFANC